MDENETAVNTTDSAASQTDIVTVDDNEARIASLETEKAKLIEESANWKVAALKYKQQVKSGEIDPDDDDDERLRRISRETLAESRLAEIAREQDAIIKKALKENKELKLALTNKGTAATAAGGSHTESQPVTDTLNSPDQLKAFQARGWTDKDIANYKKNLLRYR